MVLVLFLVLGVFTSLGLVEQNLVQHGGEPLLFSTAFYVVLRFTAAPWFLLELRRRHTSLKQYFGLIALSLVGTVVALLVLIGLAIDNTFVVTSISAVVRLTLEVGAYGLVVEILNRVWQKLVAGGLSGEDKARALFRKKLMMAGGVGVGIIGLALVTRPEPFVSLESELRARGNSPDHLDVLFVGNSLTYEKDMPAKLVEVARLAGIPQPVRSYSLTFPAYTLAMHIRSGAVRRAINSGAFDVMVLQEGSRAVVYGPESTRTSVATLTEWAKTAGMDTVFMTIPPLEVYPLWIHPTNRGVVQVMRTLGYPLDEISPAAHVLLWDRPRREGATPLMADLWGESNRLFSETSSLRIVPTGRVTELAQAALPDLEFTADGNHPSALGAYLNTRVFFAVLYPGISFPEVEAMGPLPPELNASNLAQLQQIVEDGLVKPVPDPLDIQTVGHADDALMLVYLYRGYEQVEEAKRAAELFVRLGGDPDLLP